MNEKEVRQILMDWDLSFTPIDESVKKICDIAKLHEQARVDRIFKEIEGAIAVDLKLGKTIGWVDCEINYDWWQNLKQQGGVA